MDKSFLSRMSTTDSAVVKRSVGNPSDAPPQATSALLDETDSGLDIDALRIVAQGINEIAPEAAMPHHYSLPTIAGPCKTTSCSRND